MSSTEGLPVLDLKKSRMQLFDNAATRVVPPPRSHFVEQGQDPWPGLRLCL
jgi:hypothetical protein